MLMDYRQEVTETIPVVADLWLMCLSGLFVSLKGPPSLEGTNKKKSLVIKQIEK